MSQGPPYEDRRHAGVELASRLGSLNDRDDVVVLALPRGGVPVGYEVARALGAPLDVFLVTAMPISTNVASVVAAFSTWSYRIAVNSCLDAMVAVMSVSAAFRSRVSITS